MAGAGIAEPSIADPTWTDRKFAAPQRMVFLRLLLKDKIALLSAAFLVLISVTAISADALVSIGILHPPNQQALLLRNQPPGTDSSGVFRVLGTDQLGRDLLSRIVFGARISLSVGALTVLISGTIGVLVGLTAGVYRGKVDDILMRLVDVQMGFPTLLLAMIVLYSAGAGIQNVILVLAITRWMVMARITRALTLSIGEAQFVESARSLGATNRRVIFIHVFPNMLSTVLVLATLEFARIMLAEASLSFLGLGIQPPSASWGLMLSQGRGYMQSAWWLAVFPGLMILFTTLSANLFASWARSISDPLQRGRTKLDS